MHMSWPNRYRLNTRRSLGRGGLAVKTAVIGVRSEAVAVGNDRRPPDLGSEYFSRPIDGSVGRCRGEGGATIGAVALRRTRSFVLFAPMAAIGALRKNVISF